MKATKLIVLTLSLAIVTGCFAQKENKKEKKGKKAETETVAPPVETSAVQETGVVTEECLVNISLFNESAKNKQFADALEPWNSVFNTCPSANKVIYSRGREIVQWELTQQKDDASYNKVFEKLMKMYDSRIKYFGDDAKYPTPWIKGIKALDYITFVKNDSLKKPAYTWMVESVDALGDKSELDVLRQLVLISGNIYTAEPAHAETYINDYLKVNEILESIANDSTNKNAAVAKQLENGLDIVFAQSGAADCGTLDKLYKVKVAENQTDYDYLKKVVSFYKRVKCTESDVYFSASVASHKIKPSAESANGCAEMSYKSGEYAQAIAFYDEATKLSNVNADKAEYQFKIAQLYYSKLSNYPRTKEYAKNSIEFNSQNGNAYLLMGLAYAGAKGIFGDPVLDKTIFWAAVDKFNKAKQIDPSLADDADKLIRTYRQYFPTKEEMFFQPQIQKGKTFFVGGWIGESTVCRE